MSTTLRRQPLPAAETSGLAPHPVSEPPSQQSLTGEHIPDAVLLDDGVSQASAIKEALDVRLRSFEGQALQLHGVLQAQVTSHCHSEKILEIVNVKSALCKWSDSGLTLNFALRRWA